MKLTPDACQAIFDKKKETGNFIVVEGINGAGKSTVIDFLQAKLQAAGLNTVFTREPGGTTIGKQIRSLLLQDESCHEMIERAELLLFAADRAIHVDKVILPALESGSTVVSDRYYLSTIAFQGYGRGIDLEKVIEINRWAANGLEPDLTIILDVSAEIGLERIRSRNSDVDSVDKFETKEELDFHRRVRDGYLSFAESSNSCFVVVDASQPLDYVLKDVSTCLSGLTSENY